MNPTADRSVAAAELLPDRAGLVINPNAWANARSPERRAALGVAFGPLGEVVETERPEALIPLFRRWSAEGRGLVGVCGGDGTVHAVVNALDRAWDGPFPRLLLLHGGTFGVVTRALGAAPVRHVRALARGAPVRTRLVEPLRVGERLAFNFGIGLFADLPAEFVRRGARGPGAVADLGLCTVASAMVNGSLAARVLRGWKGELRLDGRARGARFGGLYASALDGGLSVVPGFGRTPRPPGHLRLVTITGAAGVHVEAARRLELVPREPAPYMVDGELSTFDGPLSVSAGPPIEVVVFA